MTRLFTRLVAAMTLLLSVQNARAQYVTIPDGNLANMLNNQYPGCMLGNMLDTTCSAIVNATLVDLHGNYVADFTGVQYFDNADSLIIHTNIATSLPTLPAGLSFLDANNNMLTSLPTLPSGLVQLHVNNNDLTQLPALPSTLSTLDAFANQLTSLPPLPNSLVTVTLVVNQLTSLPPLPSSLYYFEVGNNLLSSLPPLPDSLVFLSAANNMLTSLPPLPSTLVWLQVSGNQLTQLPSLPPVMNNVSVANNPNLVCLPPVSEITYMVDISNTGITCLPNVIEHPGSWPQIDTLPLCGPGGTGCPVAWNILGYAFEDANGNCMRDASEQTVGNVKVTLHQGGSLIGQTYTNANGMYSFDTDLGTFTLSIDTTGLPFNVTCPSGNSYTVDITALDSLDESAEFGLECLPGFDVGVTSAVLDSGMLFPAQHSVIDIFAGGMASIYSVDCNLSGVSGNVSATIDGPVQYLGTPSGAVPPTNVMGNTLVWDIADFSTVDFYNDFSIELVTDTFLSSNALCIDVTVTGLGPGSDVDTYNNTLHHCFAVGNSYDPNFKEAYPINTTTPDEWITYTVHFQNTGTAPAINIVLRDTLDTNLQLETFTYLAASHGVVTNVQEGGIAVFEFPNIFLADSNSNEPESHGWVQYKIKTKASITNPTTIYNSASIYFDFNAPVKTNTTENVYQLTSVEKVSSSNVLSLQPNPASQIVNVFHQGVSENSFVVVTDITGRIIINQPVGNRQTSLDVQELAQGLYNVQLVERNKAVGVQKLSIVK